MATTVLLKHPQSGLIKKGFFGYSWTMFFWGGFPPLFRGDLLTGVLMIILWLLTGGLGTFIYAFFYNKKYTTGLLEKGYVFDDTPEKVIRAKLALGVAV